MELNNVYFYAYDRNYLNRFLYPFLVRVPFGGLRWPAWLGRATDWAGQDGGELERAGGELGRAGRGLERGR